MKLHEFQTLERKLNLQTREGRDHLAFFFFDGKLITQTRHSHGKRDLSRWAPLIRQQLKLSESQMAGIIECRNSHDDYVQWLRAKGLIL